jgi:hypothetical protein
MPITSRFNGNGVADVRGRYLLPGPIYGLFDKAPPIGNVYTRRDWRLEYARSYYRRQELDDLWYWVLPAFTNYYSDPRTRVIVIGHILLCGLSEETPLEVARSRRLFSASPEERVNRYHELHRVMSRCPSGSSAVSA